MAGTERYRELKATVRQYIAANDMLTAGQAVTVALSGGADSVCLLLLLHDLSYQVQAAHCNFHLRGEESNRDQRFVEDLCERLHIPLHLQHFDTITQAKNKGQSIEMAARELRYQWFATFGTPVAIAHHSDDNVETMLLNLVRGTGLRGLCGIQPRANIMGASVVRPLLCASRQQIIDALASINQPFVTDSTNLEAVARRNIIRLQILPTLATLNPSVTSTLAAEAQRFAEAQRLIDESLDLYSQTAKTGNTISVQALDKCPAPLTLLHHLLTPYGFNTATIECILAERHGQNGAIYNSPTHRLLRHDGMLVLQAREEPDTFLSTIDIDSEIILPDGQHLKAELCEVPCSISRTPNIATLDADKLQLPLTIRYATSGDRFQPYGMMGTKLVSDFLTDLHLNVFDKERQIVVLSGNKIVWVLGRRVSQAAAVTQTTKNVLRLSLTT